MAPARPADVIDVFVHVVVLNLAIEYVPSVISEGFTLSLLTAVLLKLALDCDFELNCENATPPASWTQWWPDPPRTHAYALP